MHSQVADWWLFLFHCFAIIEQPENDREKFFPSSKQSDPGFISHRERLLEMIINIFLMKKERQKYWGMWCIRQPTSVTLHNFDFNHEHRSRAVIMLSLWEQIQ